MSVVTNSNYRCSNFKARKKTYQLFRQQNPLTSTEILPGARSLRHHCNSIRTNRPFPEELIPTIIDATLTQQDDVPCSKGVKVNFEPSSCSSRASFAFDAGLRNCPSAAFRFHWTRNHLLVSKTSLFSFNRRTSIWIWKGGSDASCCRNCSRFLSSAFTTLFTTNSMLTSCSSGTIRGKRTIRTGQPSNEEDKTFPHQIGSEALRRCNASASR